MIRIKRFIQTLMTQPDNGIDEDCSGVDLFLEKKVFPNPTRDQLFIHYPNIEKVNFQLYNMDGRLILEENHGF